MNLSAAVLGNVEIQKVIETWVDLNFKMLTQWLRLSTALTLTWRPVWIAACPGSLPYLLWEPRLGRLTCPGGADPQQAWWE